MKALSTGQEATIDIDSLCEGLDYSSKISRARFEDLISVPLLKLREMVSTHTQSLGGKRQSLLTLFYY
jgi:molecular chaperone DnaK (HSP70)